MKADEETTGAERRARMAENEGASQPSGGTHASVQRVADEVRAVPEPGGGQTGDQTTPGELADLRHTGTAIGHRGHDEPAELTDEH